MSQVLLLFSPLLASLLFPPLRFGDRDLDLAEANPLRLRALLEANEPEGALGDKSGGDNEERRAGGWGVSIVLLHSCYPFMREAGHLASVYSKVSAGDTRMIREERLECTQTG